jgi:hypothetical protein
MPSAITRSELIGKTHANSDILVRNSLVVATLDFNIYQLLARFRHTHGRPQSHLANLRLAQALPKIRERTTGDAAQPACCVLGLAFAFFIDAAGLEFREPSAEFGQLGRREPQDRFLDIFDCHGRRNSTPASELEEPVAGKPGCAEVRDG